MQNSFKYQLWIETLIKVLFKMYVIIVLPCLLVLPLILGTCGHGMLNLKFLFMTIIGFSLHAKLQFKSTVRNYGTVKARKSFLLNLAWFEGVSNYGNLNLIRQAMGRIKYIIACCLRIKILVPVFSILLDKYNHPIVTIGTWLECNL